MPDSLPTRTFACKALEKAAKYICTVKCGRCPFMEEQFPCQGECSSETIPWQCWYAYFVRKAEEERDVRSGQEFTKN